MLVIQLMANVFGRGLCGGELHFADERAPPGLVDARAELRFHFFELLLPGFVFGRDFQASAFAADGSRARGERVADDTRPRGGEPGQRGFRAFEAPHDTA